jgi:hypothetical protein
MLYFDNALDISEVVIILGSQLVFSDNWVRKDGVKERLNYSIIQPKCVTTCYDLGNNMVVLFLFFFLVKIHSVRWREFSSKIFFHFLSGEQMIFMFLITWLLQHLVFMSDLIGDWGFLLYSSWLLLGRHPLFLIMI